MQDEKRYIQKETRLNFILSCFIVLLHSQCMDLLSSQEMLEGRIMKICTTIRDAAVPTFFMVSAFLFYRDFELKKLTKKLKSRHISIVWSYVLWNIIFGLVYMVMYYVPWTQQIVLDAGFSFDSTSFLKNILLSNYNVPLWFLRVLFFMC